MHLKQKHWVERSEQTLRRENNTSMMLSFLLLSQLHPLPPLFVREVTTIHEESVLERRESMKECLCMLVPVIRGGVPAMRSNGTLQKSPRPVSQFKRFTLGEEE